MERVKYESPVFDFQELKLMERVANECWGKSVMFYDLDGNGNPYNNPEDSDNDGMYDRGDVRLDLRDIFGSNGCNGSNAATAINKYVREHYENNNVPVELNAVPSDCNTQNDRFVAISS